jgi:hypothetical protein
MREIYYRLNHGLSAPYFSEYFRNTYSQAPHKGYRNDKTHMT